MLKGEKQQQLARDQRPAAAGHVPLSGGREGMRQEEQQRPWVRYGCRKEGAQLAVSLWAGAGGHAAGGAAAVGRLSSKPQEARQPDQRRRLQSIMEDGEE